MGVALTIVQYLNVQRIAYDVITHASTASARASARAGRVPGDRVAKAVVLRDHHGFWLAVLPASRRLQLSKVTELLHEPVDLASEEQIEPLFTDCLPGAVPALGTAYGLQTLVDDSLDVEPEIYLEGGDHESLVRISGASFRKLMSGARHGHFAEPASGAH